VRDDGQAGFLGGDERLQHDLLTGIERLAVPGYGAARRGAGGVSGGRLRRLFTRGESLDNDALDGWLDLGMRELLGSAAGRSGNGLLSDKFLGGLWLVRVLWPRSALREPLLRRLEDLC
jgi:hypothetical protein